MTRDGSPVKIHCTNYNTNQPIIAEIEGNNCSESFNKDGKWLNFEDSEKDLFFAPEKHEGYVNVIRNEVYNEAFCGKIYASKKEAESNANNATLATARIEWEE